MSFTIVERTSAPLYRSKLFLPGSQVKFFEKAAKGPADVVCLDLEDAVAPNDKEQARKNVVEALNTVDFGDKLVTVLSSRVRNQKIAGFTALAGPTGAAAAAGGSPGSG